MFDEDEKEDITRDMAQLQEHHDELRNFIDDELEGFVELFSNFHSTLGLSTSPSMITKNVDPRCEVYCRKWQGCCLGKILRSPRG